MMRGRLGQGESARMMGAGGGTARFLQEGLIFRDITGLLIMDKRVKSERKILMPPLRPYEMPYSPATALAIPPERDVFVVPGEHPSPEEARYLPRPVILPPLLPGEMPDSAVRVLPAGPGRLPDEPEWGPAQRAPEITPGKGNLLRPWDD